MSSQKNQTRAFLSSSKVRRLGTKFRLLTRMTSFRLTIIFMMVFIVFSIFLVSVSLFTVTTVLHREARAVITEELNLLQSIYRRGGLGALIFSIERRSRAPGASLYMIVDRNGAVYAGNVQRLPANVLGSDRWINEPFDYKLLSGQHSSNESEDRQFDRSSGDGRKKIKKGERRAIARVKFLRDGVTLLVGRDFGQPRRFATIVMSTLIFMVIALALIALISWFFLGRRALRRIEMVSQASKRIIAGDLSQRLPETGNQDEFDRLSSALNAMLEKIENLDGGIKDIADSVAHDLKTPLTRLRNRAEAALVTKANMTKKQYRDALEDTLAQSDQIIKIFNALLMISRVEAGSQAGSLVLVDLKTIVEDIGELYEAATEESGVSFRVNIQEGDMPWIIHGNRELLGQALSNLIENALKYGETLETDHDGNVRNLTVISLLLQRGTDHIRLIVEDNGPGIASQDRDRVKERFVRLEKSRTKPGSGLGLSMVNAVSNLHDGRLLFEDNQPGLRAVIELPVN